MKRNKLFTFLVVSAVAIGAMSSCTKNFEEMNTAQGGIATEDIPLGPSFLTPQRAVVFNVNNTTYEYQIIQNLIHDLWSGYMATPTSFSSGRNNSTYYMSDSWNNAHFNYQIQYGNTTIASLITSSNERNYVEFTQIAKIIGAIQTLKLTDSFGAVPYSQANVVGATTVPYDSQQEIYTQLVNSLTEASDSLQIFMTSSEYEEAYSLNRFKEYDEICAGDLALWQKFANTLRLRMAIRASNVDPTWAQAEGEAAMAADGGILTSSDKAIANTSSAINNPLALITSSWLDILGGAPLISILEGYDDPRLEKYLKPMTEDIVDDQGVTQPTKGKYYAVRSGIDIGAKADRSSFSQLNIETSSSESPLYWMKTSEAYFLQAEAALRGWAGVSGTAQSLYEEGIAQSFSETGATMPSDYLERTTTAAPYVDIYSSKYNYESGKWLNDAPVAWQSAGTKEQQLHQIITQKWIALYPDGPEAWAEHRRTGYPKQFPVVANYSGSNLYGYIDSETFVRRCEYTTSEMDTNPVECQKAIDETLGGDNSGNARVWWDTDAIVTGKNNL